MSFRSVPGDLKDIKDVSMVFKGFLRVSRLFQWSFRCDRGV